MKSFNYTRLDDGTHSIRVYGEHSTVSSEVIIPEMYQGAPVTEITFGRMLDANFSRLYIPASVKRIDLFDTLYSVFAASITVDENNPYFCSDGKALYSRDGKILYRLFPRYIEEYTVMPGTEILEEKAFSNHQNLKRLELPEGLREIKRRCFDNCSGITELDIPDSVTEIGEMPFMDMWNLRSLHLPGKIKTLGFMLLRTLKLAELYIPASVERISEHMAADFMDRIDKYTVSPENRFFCSQNGVIYSKDMTALVRAPRVVPSVFDVPESVRVIAENAFNGCEGINEIVLHDGLEYIGKGTFSSFGLQDITVPKSVRAIGKDAFCPLRSITVYDTLKADTDFLFPSLMDIYFHKRELIVRSAETNEIKHRMWLDLNTMETRDIFRSCFDENWNFDYDRFDRSLLRIQNPIQMTLCAAYRLKNPPEPAPEAQRRFTDILRKNGMNIIIRYIEAHDFENFARIAEFVLTEDNIIGIIDYAAEKNAVEFTAYLLNFRNEHFRTPPDNMKLD